MSRKNNRNANGADQENPEPVEGAPVEVAPAKGDTEPVASEAEANEGNVEAPEASAPDQGLVRVQCICSNVHLGDGRVLYGKGVIDEDGEERQKGDQADIPSDIANMLEESGQVVKVAQ